jgi:chromosome segregation ATPase
MQSQPSVEIRRLEIQIQNLKEDLETARLKLAEQQAHIEFLKHRIDQMVSTQVRVPFKGNVS